MKVIGVTGGVGAGKSTVLQYLEDAYKGVLLIADRIAEELMRPGTELYQKVKEKFPPNVFLENGELNRPAMATLIFQEPERRLELNGLVHPAVKEAILDRIKEEENRGTALVVLESALLLEEHYDAFCTEIWYIDTSIETRVSRLEESRGYSRKKAEQIMAAQLSREFFLQHATYVVKNDGTPEETWKQIDRLLGKEGEHSYGHR